jgi:hypothetical protein
MATLKLTKCGQTIRTTIRKRAGVRGYRVNLYVAGCNVHTTDTRRDRAHAVAVAAELEEQAAAIKVLAGGHYVEGL